MQENTVVIELSEQEIADLRQYAQTLKEYIDPEISKYSIGCRKRPKEKKLEAEKIKNTRSELEEKLEIGWRWATGLWELDIVGANHNPGSSYCDKGYWWIFPLKSYKKHYLDFLAKALPEYFPEKEFYVASTMIPAGI